MSGPIALLLLSLALGATAVGLTATVFHPLVAYYAIWSVVSAVDAANLLGLPPVAGKAILILALGQVAVLLGAVLVTALVPRPASRSPANPDAYSREPRARQLATSPSPTRLWIAVAVLGVTVLIAVITFRTSIEGAAGLPLTALSLEEIRALTISGPAAHTGIASLGLTLAALLAACGVVIAERKRAIGGAIAIAAIVATTVSPQRTNTLTALGVVFALLLYRRAQRPRRRRRQSSYPLIVGVIGVVVVGVVFFNTVGNRLNKNSLFTNAVHSTTVPESLVPLTVYWPASTSALSTTLS